MSEDRIKEKLELVDNGVRCGRIHTVVISALGDETSEIYYACNLDLEKESPIKVGNLNLRIIGLLHILIDMVVDGTSLDDGDGAAVSHSIKVVDDNDDKG